MHLNKAAAFSSPILHSFTSISGKSFDILGQWILPLYLMTPNIYEN